MIVTGKGWTMHRGDCLSVMATMPALSVDHTITDPPFETEAHTKQRRALKDNSQKRGVEDRGELRRVDKVLSFPALSETDRKIAAREFGRLTRRWVVAFCQIEAIAAWRRQLVDEGGLDWIRGGIWHKPNGMPQFTGDRPGMGFEALAIAHPAGRKKWNGGGRHAVWSVPLDHRAGGGGQNEHETRKPDAIMLALVADFTDPGDLILDPFAGSGTTGVAALRLGRRFIGVERDEKYFQLACDRLRAEEQGSTLQALRAGQGALFE